MAELTLIQKICVWAIPVIFAITVHEVAHGWVASKLGDQTAKILGRLTLNPIKHIDPLGTVVLPILMLAFSPFIFGWAKPVPVDKRNLQNPRRDMALVAAAGPAANLFMLILWAIFAKLVMLMSDTLSDMAIPMFYMAMAGVSINAILMVLNMIPVPPLDGSRVVSSFLPPDLDQKYNRLEQYGLFILVLLLVTGVLGKILWPPVSGLQSLVYHLLGI